MQQTEGLCVMRPQNTTDWIRLGFLLVGAFSRPYFVTGVNILDLVLEKIRDPLDDLVFILITLSGVYSLIRVLHAPRAAASGSARGPA